MTTKPTPAAEWRENGEPDPHAGHYDGPREKLTLGHISDDALANGAFMNYDQPLDIARTLAGDKNYFSPICWMTAVKERIRWLSRALVKAEEKLISPDDQVLSDLSAQFFTQRGVSNFIENNFEHPDHGSMSVTIQKTSGKTPGELHDEVKVQRDSFRTALVAYGKHQTDCLGGISGRTCTCGLDDMLKADTGESPEKISPVLKQALAKVGNLAVLNKEANVALAAYEKAFSDLFAQCCSNPVKNTWGRQVNFTLLNEAHELAGRVGEYVEDAFL